VQRNDELKLFLVKHKFLQQIEELRSRMIKSKEGRSYTDPEVITASQELYALLDKYQEMMLNNKADMEE
jgi:hypothetical protein